MAGDEIEELVKYLAPARAWAAFGAPRRFDLCAVARRCSTR